MCKYKHVIMTYYFFLFDGLFFFFFCDELTDCVIFADSLFYHFCWGNPRAKRCKHEQNIYLLMFNARPSDMNTRHKYVPDILTFPTQFVMMSRQLPIQVVLFFYCLRYIPVN